MTLCLKSILALTVLPDEVIIADDGSTVETKNTVEEFKKICPIPIHHVWHEDNGFRLAEIRNKAIIKAQFDYIIQIDGDVILHKKFIQDYKNIAKKNGMKQIIIKNQNLIICLQIKLLKIFISLKNNFIFIIYFKFFYKPLLEQNIL